MPQKQEEAYQIKIEDLLDKRYTARVWLKNRETLANVKRLEGEGPKIIEDYCTVIEAYISKGIKAPLAYGIYIASDIACQTLYIPETAVKEAGRFRPINFNECYPTPISNTLEDLAWQINGSPAKNTKLLHAMFEYIRESSKAYIEGLQKKLPKVEVRMDSDGSEYSYPIPMEKRRNSTKYTWNDFAGYPAVLQKFKDISLLMENAEHATEHMDGKIVDVFDKGIILMGPPGTGKTHIVRILADEVNVPYKHVSLPDVGSKYVNESMENMQRQFNIVAAPILRKESLVSLMLIDECDGLLRRRSDSNSEESCKVVNTFLDNTDGHLAVDGVLVFMTTNLEHLIDEAATRAGRAGRKIKIGRPDQEGCLQILSLYAKRYNPETEIDIQKVISKLTFQEKKEESKTGLTEGTVGAESKEVCRRAKLKRILQHIKTNEPFRNFSQQELQYEIDHYYEY